MKGVAGVLVGLCCALVIACAGGATASKVSLAGRPTDAHGSQDPHEQITELDKQIDTDRQTMGLPEAPPNTCVADSCPVAVSSQPLPTKDPKCQPGPSDACHDSCRLADSICDSASKICKLATDLAPDPWSAGKCTSANTTCEAARTKCCGCQL